MTEHELSTARRSRIRWLPGPLRRALSRRADRLACARYADLVRRQVLAGGPSDELARVAAESFVALYEPDGEMVLPHPALQQAIVDQFHKLYHAAGATTWGDTHWRGARVLQIPLDLWIYQELIHGVGPELIVETGTNSGGNALYLADLCELAGRGRVVTIDVEDRPDRPQHARITYLLGSSTSDEIVQRVRSLLPSGGPVLVALDSDHSAPHVLEEIRLYAPMVTVGSYLIVEDTAVNGHPAWPSFGPGPMEAVQEFLAGTREFEADETMEKFLVTSNRNGYLRRVRPPD